MTPHPLGAMLDAAARGEFPPRDGLVEVLPAPPGRVDIAIGFTAHFVIAADVDVAAVHARVAPGDFSTWMSAPFLNWLADQLGSRPTTFDALLCATGTGAGAPDWLEREDDVVHPRVERASRYREDAQVFRTADRRSVLVVGRGICGRWEIGYEVDPGAQGRGTGRRLAAAAAAGLVPAGAPVWAQVAPGNAASMRSTMAGGFVPVAAEVLFPRDGQ